MSKFTLALIQEAPPREKQAALTNTIQKIEAAAQRGADLVLLQELHCGYYFCQREDTALFDLAEPIPGPSSAQLSNIAKKLQIVLVASLFEKRASGLYHNTAIVFERDGKIGGIYRKMHIPDDPGYHEKFYFAPGDLGFIPIETSVGKLGILICWDQWFPEAARLMALAGADILLYPTAIGWDSNDSQAEQRRQLDAWITVQRGHAIANALPIAVCNRVGFEPGPEGTSGINFWGSSFIAGPQGEIFEQASIDTAEIRLATIDTKQSEEIRRIWPFYRDRRIDHYAKLNRFSV